MTASDRRSALAALEAVRPGMARLDASRDPEEIAADIIEIWSSVETALRSLMGGSTLSGQPLIRELRSRELISLEQAHALLELQAVRERVDRTDYHPSDVDVAVARDAYNTLQSGLVDRPVAPSPANGAAQAASAAPAPSASAGGAESAAVYVPLPLDGERRARGPLWAVALVVLAVLVIAALGMYWYLHSRGGIPADVAAGIAQYERGQPEAARAAFSKAAHAHPELALPHLYLGRIAREEGDFVMAGNELKTAVELEPRAPDALRELGAFFLARGTHFANDGRADLATSDYNAARRTYVQALQIDPADSASRGYLGCALTRLGRADEAATWLARAGNGPWSACAVTAEQRSP